MSDDLFVITTEESPTVVVQGDLTTVAVQEDPDLVSVITNNPAPAVIRDDTTTVVAMISGAGAAGPPGPPGTGSTINVEYNGVSLGTTIERLNFTGSGVVATLDSPGEVKVEITGGGGAALAVKRPEEYGAVMADLTNLDASTDVADELQAFFTDMHDPTIGPYYYWDWSGRWAVSKPLYAVNPRINTGVLDVEYHARYTRCGLLHILPVASQPGGVAMDTVLTISGQYTHWVGHCMIQAGDGGTAAYANRRFKRGLRVIQAGQGSMEKLTVISAKKQAIWVDSQYETWNETTIGAPYPTGSTSKNNIGFTIDDCVGLNCGSTQQFGLTDGRSFSLTVFAKTQGHIAAGAFATGSAGFENSGEQRTRISLSTGSTEFEVGEYGMVRTERVAADYTSIAADSTTKKFTFTLNTPASHGLTPGVFFMLEDTGAVGANDGIEYEVISVSGQDVFVYPAPTTETAKVYSKLTTRFSLHRIMEKIDNTAFTVFPWVPDSANSKWYHISGGAKVSGNDAAGVNFGYLGSIWSGMGLHNETLYGVNVNDYVFDFCNIGVAHGIDFATACIGLSLGHGHSEAVRFDVVQMTQPWGNFKYSADSSFSGNIMMLDARSATSAQLQRSYELFNADIHVQGQRYPAKDQVSRINDGSIDNTPKNSVRVFVDDVGAFSRNCVIGYDEQSARLGRKTARVYWASYNGAALIATMNFSLDAAMTGRGWTLVGDTVVPAAGDPLLFHIIYDVFDKVVTVFTVGLPSPNIQPFTKNIGFDIVQIGGDEVQITRNSAGFAQATFAMNDDFRLRIQPLQNNKYIQVGIDNSEAVLVDQNTFDAYVYFLNDTTFGPFVAGYGQDTGAGVTGYAANDYVWLEKIGTVAKIYKGGPTFNDALFIWQFTMDVSSFDFIRVMAPTDGAAAKLKLFPIDRLVPSKSVTDTTTARTASPADNGRFIRFTNAGAITFTIDANVAMPPDAEISGLQLGGTITLAGTNGATIRSYGPDLTTAGVGAAFTLKRDGNTNNWDAIGRFS